MKMNWWKVSRKLLNESSFFPFLFKWQELIVRARDIEAIGSAETSTRNRGSHLFPNLFSSRFSPFFCRGRTLFEIALSPHGYNCCSVSWKKESHGKIEVEGNKEEDLCSCPFLFLFSSLACTQRRERFLLRIRGILSRKRVAAGSRCLPDVLDVPLTTTTTRRDGNRQCGSRIGSRDHRDFQVQRVNHVLIIVSMLFSKFVDVRSKKIRRKRRFTRFSVLVRVLLTRPMSFSRYINLSYSARIDWQCANCYLVLLSSIKRWKRKEVHSAQVNSYHRYLLGAFFLLNIWGLALKYSTVEKCWDR